MIWILFYFIGSLLATYLTARRIGKNYKGYSEEDQPEYAVVYLSVFLGSWLSLLFLWLTKR